MDSIMSRDGPGRKPRVTDDEIVAVIREDERPVLTTSMIAEQLPIKRRGLLKRLNALTDDGRVEQMDVGPRSQVWYVDDTMTGRVPESITSDVLEIFSDRDDRAEPLTVPEVAKRLGHSHQAAQNKLHDLEEKGKIASKGVDSSAKVWWVPISSDPELEGIDG